ncbi:hypothetical protein LOTGIDRAFT_189619 [Lottia gigantea]|uniref:KAT8 regulatory NSL complex subunit 2 n=1 Tax=Lottia gigantea TaxID=225164 RepID=V4BYV6_LOTGI|nr:hypothetical protein LOTGIDRAFT_189619 [Lottia gigantea]ESO94304.1 hypothetical protein LOTGIDRAFT_189619 [Lottia gigantea]
MYTSRMNRGKPTIGTGMIRHNKIKTITQGLYCNYSNRNCQQKRLEGFEFCIRHILEDKSAPFKQCNYVAGKKSERCQNGVPKGDRKDGYCVEHTRKVNFARQKKLLQPRPADTPESLLQELTISCTTGDAIIKSTGKSRLPPDSIASKVLDYASSDDSDDGPALIEDSWYGDVDSDAESIDSEQEDLLKHAGVYTAEEVTLMLRDKLIRLQSLYIEQFKRLQHQMKEKRRQYLHDKKLERESGGIVSVQAYKEDPYLRKKYNKLKAYRRYHNRYGREAILHRKSNERRQQISEGVNYKPPYYPKCHATDSGVKCTTRSVPLSKYCMKHILKDHQQVLFQPCSFANGQCGKPVVTHEDNPRCPLHYTPIDENCSRSRQNSVYEGLDQADTSTDSTLSAAGELDRTEVLIQDTGIVEGQLGGEEMEAESMNVS